MKLSDIAKSEAIVPPEGKPTLEGRCRICTSETKYGYSEDDVFSNAFTDASSLRGGDCICWRCKYLADQTPYRRYHWIATESNGIEVTKDRQTLLETLNDPPGEPWMMQVVSDYLNVLNGWINAQKLNINRERYDVVVDRDRVTLELEIVQAMTGLARELRERDVAKRVLRDGPDAADFDRYDITTNDMKEINRYVGRPSWELIIRLVE